MSNKYLEKIAEKAKIDPSNPRGETGHFQYKAMHFNGKNGRGISLMQEWRQDKKRKAPDMTYTVAVSPEETKQYYDAVDKGNGDKALKNLQSKVHKEWLLGSRK